MDVVKIVYQPLSRRAARQILVGRARTPRRPEGGRFTRRDVDRLLDSAWHEYDETAPDLGRQATLGSTMNVRLACFTLAFFNQLLVSAVDREYAIELVSDAAWRIYRLWVRPTQVAARFALGHQSALAFASRRPGTAEVSLRFPFNAPGYRIETVSVVGRGTGFDVTHCPVATYFREHGATDLCVSAWCGLDYALADVTHQKLVRTKTLVQGQGRCDFRISPAETGDGATPPDGQRRAVDGWQRHARPRSLVATCGSAARSLRAAVKNVGVSRLFRASAKQTTAVPVAFSIIARDAHDVCLAGSFNQWDPLVLHMKPDGSGSWNTKVPLERGRYEYKFLVDGQWCCDAIGDRPHSSAYAPNPFGTMNRVATVP